MIYFVKRTNKLGLASVINEIAAFQSAINNCRNGCVAIIDSNAVYLDLMGRLPSVAFVALGFVINSSVMAQDAMVGFHMPSQNIWCNYDARGTKALECDVIQRAWKDWAPREQVDGGTMGKRFEIKQTGLATAVNSSDTMKGTNGFTLHYDSKLSFESITCNSSTLGLTCTNKTGGLMHLNRSFYTLNKPVPQ